MGRLRQFEPSDYYAIADPLEGDAIISDFDVISKGIAYTYEDDNKKVCACGGVIFWENNIAEFWTRISGTCVLHKACAGIKCAFDILKDVVRESVCVCRVKRNFDKGERFASWLGFVKDHQEIDCTVYRIP